MVIDTLFWRKSCQSRQSLLVALVCQGYSANKTSGVIETHGIVLVEKVGIDISGSSSARLAQSVDHNVRVVGSSLTLGELFLFFHMHI